MGVSLYVVLDNPNLGLESFVDGKAVAGDVEALDEIAEQLGVTPLSELVGMSSEEMEEMFGDEGDVPELQARWFSPDDGLLVVQALAEYVKANPDSVGDATRVIEDLSGYASVFAKAKEAGAQWHFAYDI